MSLVGWLVVGLVAGFVAQRITGVERQGCLLTIAIGVIGAFVGGGLYRLLRDDEEVLDTLDVESLVLATLGAIVLLLVSGRGTRRSSRGRRRR